MGYPSYLDGSNGQPAEPAWIEMPLGLKAELDEFVSRYERPVSGLDGPCCWYDPQSRTCLHHEHRPRVCRDFQIGSEDCIGWREVYSIGEETRA